SRTAISVSTPSFCAGISTSSLALTQQGSSTGSVGPLATEVATNDSSATTVSSALIPLLLRSTRTGVGTTHLAIWNYYGLGQTEQNPRLDELKQIVQQDVTNCLLSAHDLRFGIGANFQIVGGVLDQSLQVLLRE